MYVYRDFRIHNKSLHSFSLASDVPPFLQDLILDTWVNDVVTNADGAHEPGSDILLRGVAGDCIGIKYNRDYNGDYLGSFLNGSKRLAGCI